MDNNALEVLIKSLVLLEDPIYNLVKDAKMKDGEARKFIEQVRNTPEFETAYNNYVNTVASAPESKNSILLKLNAMYTKANNAGKYEVATKILGEIARWNSIEESNMCFKIIIEDKTEKNGNI